MFQQIWHSILLLTIVAFAGYVINGSDPCNKSFRAGSIIRVPATGVESLASNWVGVETQAGIRKNANAIDSWFQGAVKRTFYGNELVCPGMAEKPLDAIESTLNEWQGSISQPTVNVNGKDKPATSATTTTSAVTGNVTPVTPIDANPLNLPSLP